MLKKDPLHTHWQQTARSSPWSFSDRLRRLLWEITWHSLCAWTPKPFNFWRLFWLKLFGAKIFGRPFVHQRARIEIPSNLIMHHHACLGDRACAYSLGIVEIMEDATVAQEAYLCTGTHDFDDPARPLQTAKITIGRSAFIGARVFILPGVTVGDNAVVAACSVVTANVRPNSIAAGNPCKEIKFRNEVN